MFLFVIIPGNLQDGQGKSCKSGIVSFEDLDLEVSPEMTSFGHLIQAMVRPQYGGTQVRIMLHGRGLCIIIMMMIISIMMILGAPNRS